MSAGTRLLIIAKDSRMVLRTVPQLKNLGYAIDIRTTLNEGLAMITDKKADVVLLGAGFPRKDVINAYNHIFDNLQVPCLLFGENTSPTSINSMLSLRIANVLIPPLIPRVVHERIEALRQNFMAEALRRKGAVKPENYADLDKIRSTIKDELSGFAGQFHKFQEGDKSDLKLGAKVFVAPILWNKHPVYLMIGIEGVSMGHYGLTRAGQALTELLKKSGSIDSGPGELLATDLKYDEFKSWAVDSDEVLSSDIPGGGSLVIAVIDASVLPEITEHESKEYLEVKLGNWLTPNTKLPINLFVVLPATKRFLLYLRKHSVVSHDVVERVERLGSNSLFMDKADRGPFIGYCLQTSGKTDADKD